MQIEQVRLHSRMEESHWWFTGRREILRRLIHQVLPPAGQTLADIGCGTGGNLAAFAEDYRCLGWDPSEEAIRLARQRYPKVRFFSGPFAEAMASIPEPADLILATDVLEHIEADHAFFSQLVTAVRPGGHLLITVPAGRELWSPHDVSVGHLRRYDRIRLEQLWAEQPVAPCLVSHYNAHLYPLILGARLWTRCTGRAGGEAQTDFRLPPAPINRLLNRIFSSEAAVLVSLLNQKRQRGFPRGVSLIALLRKHEGNADAS